MGAGDPLLTDEPFWLVWQPESGFPTVRRETYVAAREEAVRLARANRGKRFYVLGTSMFAETGDLRLVEFKRIDDLPL